MSATAPAPVLDGSPPAPVGDFPRQGLGLYLTLSAYWLALSFLWSGMITFVIQGLVEKIAPGDKDLILGVTLALGALVSTVVCLIVGTLSDRSRRPLGRRRPYLIIGTLLTVPALVGLPFVPTVPGARSLILLILVFCLIQLWTNVATAPYQALVPDMVPKHRQGTASGYLGMGSLVGQLAGILTYGLFLKRENGLLLIMVIVAGVLLAAMAFTVWRLPERPLAVTADALPEPGLWETLRASFSVNPREYPDFFRLIASRFVINMGFYTVTQFLSYYVKDTLHPADPQGSLTLIFLIATASGLVGTLPAGLLSDRISKKRVVYVSMAITGLAALLFLLTHSTTIALMAAFVFGCGFGAFTAVDWALATNLLPEHDEAKYMGVWHVAFTVPQVIAPLVGGIVATLFAHVGPPGFRYRVVMFLVLAYVAWGTALLRPLRERILPKPAA